MVDSLVEGILFRSSVSLGTFYVDDDTNTVMGPAVTDAAAWYDSADWVGINATPHATLAIQALIEHERGTVGHVLIDYPVPMKKDTAQQKRTGIIRLQPTATGAIMSSRG